MESLWHDTVTDRIDFPIHKTLELPLIMILVLFINMIIVVISEKRLQERGTFLGKMGHVFILISFFFRRLAWPLRKDDTQIREAFHIFASATSSLPRLLIFF